MATALLLPDKRLSVFEGWSQPEPDTWYSWFNAPIEIDGITSRPGFVLHGGCLLNQA